MYGSQIYASLPLGLDDLTVPARLFLATLLHEEKKYCKWRKEVDAISCVKQTALLTVQSSPRQEQGRGPPAVPFRSACSPEAPTRQA